jgi:putative membrane protein
MRRLSILLALAGLAVAALLVLRFDVGQVVGAALSIGWAGFAVLLLWQGMLFVILGLAWCVVVPGVRPPRLIWGRMVRDAATTCLPFSPVGGYVIGARAVTLRGTAWPTAAAGTVVDVTAEVISQVLFSLMGLALLVLLQPGSGFARPVAAALALVVVFAILVFMQRRRIARAIHMLGSKFLGDWFRAQEGIGRLRAEMERLYGSPARLLIGTALHLVAWCGTAVGTWISLRLLGRPVDLLAIVALEALLDAMIGAAFIVPGAAGVQEAGYVGLGAAFGVPPEIALSVSLLRRAKDVGWGLPILGAWQWQEVRRL